MKALITKPYTDRLLRANGYTADNVVVGENGRYIAIKGATCVVYQTLHNTHLVVTVDRTLLDLWQYFGLTSYEKTREYSVYDEMSPLNLLEVDEIVFSKEHMLPVYIVELNMTTPIPVGYDIHGKLKGQCSTALKIWYDEIEHMGQYGDVGYTLAECAIRFWTKVRGLRTLYLLHPLAEFCLGYEVCDSGINYVPYIPALSADTFVLDKSANVVPITSICSLSVYSILMNAKLYTTRGEY